jgi:hypothetical protein
MKRLLLILSLLAPTAHAVDLELAVGASHYKEMPNGFWYQEGLPHTLDLTSAAAQVGATGAILPWLDWHADYVWLGRVKSDAIATPDDANYNPQTHSCRGECIARSRFVGNGFVHGVALTLEPHFDYQGWRFGVSAGPFIYRAAWNETVYDWVGSPSDQPHTISVNQRQKWNVGKVIGVSVSRGPITLQYQRFFDQPRSDEAHGDFPGLWRHTDMVSIKYRW